MVRVSERDLATFRSRFTGQVVTPADSEYDHRRSVWNGAINRRPALIAQCASAAEVAAAILFARSHGLEISVRGEATTLPGSRSVTMD